jgi:hypothetical protein
MVEQAKKNEDVDMKTASDIKVCTNTYQAFGTGYRYSKFLKIC